MKTKQASLPILEETYQPTDGSGSSNTGSPTPIGSPSLAGLSATNDSSFESVKPVGFQLDVISEMMRVRETEEDRGYGGPLQNGTSTVKGICLVPWSRRDQELADDVMERLF